MRNSQCIYDQNLFPESRCINIDTIQNGRENFFRMIGIPLSHFRIYIVSNKFDFNIYFP